MPTSKQRLTNITQNERQNKGVVALADRPNVVSAYGKGGLSPLELKVWFDKLGNLMADKINEIQNALNDSGQDYIGIDNLGENIACLGDLTASFLNGSFATLLLAYHSTADMGDSENLATLQTIINEKARLISELDEAFANYKTLVKSNSGAAEVGIADEYNGSGKKLSNLVADIASGVLATKITFECYGFATANKATATSVGLKTFVDNVADALQGDLNCGLLEKIADRYTKAEANALLNLKVDKSTYNSEQIAQNTRLTALEGRATAAEGNIGEMSNVTPIAADIALAIKSLNEDIDSLQLGVIPRVIRGVINDTDPDELDADLITALNAAVLSATGRSTPNNSDAVNVLDNQMPDAGRIYTYYYWSSDVVGSELDGWYLAAYYVAPSITEIPSYVFNILLSSWSPEPDENGLYYISVPATQHGMGTDASLYVDLRKLVDSNKYASQNLYYVSTNGEVIIYSDEKFTGKLVVRVGRAYYTANTTYILEVEIEQVNGLQSALDEKVDADGGSVEDTISAVDTAQTSVAAVDTAADIQTEAERILATGLSIKVFFGRLRAFLRRLGSLAFKSKISDTDVDADAAISQSKINGLTTDLSTKATTANLTAHTGNTNNPHSVTKAQIGLGSVNNTSDAQKPVSTAQQTALNAKVTAAGGEVGSCVSALTEDTAGSRTNLSGGDTVKVQLGKIKRWFSALGTLAFKSSISNADVAANAAITASKFDLTTLRNLLYPVGSIKMTTVNTNPSTYLGGTWVAWGQGRVPIGVGSIEANSEGAAYSVTAGTINYSTAEFKDGEKAHTLSVAELPSHSHQVGGGSPFQGVFYKSNYAQQNYSCNDSPSNGNLSQTTATQLAGGGQSHNNLQPYITCYMWKRTT